MHVIKEPLQPSFDKAGIQGKIFESQSLTNDLEFVLVTTETGHETTIIEHDSTFAYYIIQGSGYFEIDGTREVCGQGDLVIVPAGKIFTYKGKMKLLLTVSPPWKEEQEETLII